MMFLENFGRGILGMAILIGICFLLSRDRKAINWQTVGVGLLLQVVLGVLILRVPLVKEIFDTIASFFVVVLDFTDAGADFVLGDWPEFVAYENQAGGGVIEIGYVFAFKVLPTIIFFSALSSLLYYLGILQLFIKGFAWVMVKTMRLTGAESLAAAANVFIGQTEAPLVVKPYLEGMSRSEILCLMTGGMATIAGGVFAAYVGFLGGDDEVMRQVFATHLLTASIMSAPAAIIAAKILLPESKSVDLDKQKLDIPRQDVGSNVLDAISGGTADGIKLAVNVGAMLLVFTAFVSMLNYISINWIGSWTGLNDWVIESTDGRFQGFNIEYMLGLLFSPIAWVLGVAWEDAFLVGQLLGLKTTLNEFFAYAALEGMQPELSEKSVLIATYALCGFANFASIGIQIGGIGAIAPGQRRVLTELGVTSLVGGTVACFLTAIVAGIMYIPSSSQYPLGATSVPESGVSLAYAQERADLLSEVVYDMQLTIPEEQNTPVEGSMTVRFTVKNAKQDVYLDFRQTSDYLVSLSLNGDSLAAEVVNDHILLPKGSLITGENTAELSFQLGDLSLNRNPDYLYTLFVPDRASTAIPLFDQPDIKARYRLSLDIPAQWEGMANGPLENTEINGDRKLLQFAETKPFSTYVLAFTAGNFKKKIATRDGREMTMLFRESDTEKVERNTDEIFDLHASSIAWMEEYTGIDMPFQKFDFALLPGFQYGGMEHIGAIFYRESSLMLDEDATETRKLGRASLIAHETAHMWFGDMVTMQWFNDVWLKEVFANFMAAKIVNPSFPEINHELRFLFAHQPSAYSEDRSEGSHPIQQELDNLKNAGTLYGRIIYQKAPVVMRQLETLVGADVFREGLQEYLKEFAYGNATWDDLINILDAKSELDLKTWSEVWVKAPHMPVYELSIEESSGETPVQLRIKAQPNPATGQYWSQETEVAFIYEDGILNQKVTLSGEEPIIDFPHSSVAPAAILPNASAIAYGYFQLDEASQEYLLANATSFDDPLLRGAARMALEEDMLRGNLSPAALFDSFLAAVKQESEPLNRQHLLGRLSQLYWRYASDEERLALATDLESTLWSLLNATDDASAKSAYWGTYVDVVLTPEGLDRLEAIWSGEQEAPVRLNEARMSSLAHELAIKRAARSAAILAELPTRIENQDRLRRLAFVRPALSADVSERDAFFESLKDPENRAVEPWVGEAVGYLHHPLRAEAALKYIRPSLELMEEIQVTGDIFFPRQWIGATLSGHNSSEAAQLVRDFLAENPDFSYRLKNKILMAADPVFRSAELIN